MYVDSGYPKPLMVWGLSSIDAAQLGTGDRIYFFVGPRYYDLSDVTSGTRSPQIPSPRSTSQDWFGCGSESGYLLSEGTGLSNPSVSKSGLWVYENKLVDHTHTRIPDPPAQVLKVLGINDCLNCNHSPGLRPGQGWISLVIGLVVLLMFR